MMVNHFSFGVIKKIIGFVGCEIYDFTCLFCFIAKVINKMVTCIVFIVLNL